MKKIIYIAAAIFSFAIVVNTGCKNPLVDDKGNDIPLLRVDLPKFEATYIIEFYTKSGNIERPVDGNISYSITGKDATKLVNEGGRINNSGNINSGGILSLNLDPNIKFPYDLEFTISGQNSNYLILPNVIKQTTTGSRQIRIEVIDLNNLPEPTPSPSDVDINASEDEKIASIPNSVNGNGYNYIALYQAETTKTYECTSNEFEDYGIYVVGEDMSDMPSKSRTIEAGTYFFVVTKPNGAIPTSFDIEIGSDENNIYASFDYEITTAAGVYTGSISNNLPIKQTIEQIYVLENDKSATIRIIPKAPFTIAEDTQNITDITSSGTINFDAPLQTSGSTASFKRCDISTIGFCSSDRKISYAITRSFQYRKKGDEDNWLNGMLEKGKTTLYLEDKQRYECRMSINNQWISYDMTTDPQDVDNLINTIPEVSVYTITPNGSDGYNINIEVTSEELCSLNI